MSVKKTPRTIAALIASLPKDLRKVALEAYESETRRCVAILKLCDEAGLSARGLEMIESCRTVEEVSELLRRAAVTARWDRTISATAIPN